MHKALPQSSQQALDFTGEVIISQTRKNILLGAKTGRLYNIKGKIHRASSPRDSAFANLTGETQKTASHHATSSFVDIGFKTDAGLFTELGTKHIAPRRSLFKVMTSNFGVAKKNIINIGKDIL